MALASQTAIHSWTRGNLLGAGSFGQVNLAMNNETGELFAVKSIPSACEGSKAMDNELRLLQSLSSPHVICCLGGGTSTESDGTLMQNLYMEWVAGGSLADLAKKFGGSLEENVIRKYTRDMVEALQYLHREGVVHCDIKGKNVLVGPNGAKLADFGSAKRITASSAKLAAVTPTGTPLWMAPEVLQQLEQGFPSDVWSLGCTIIEMATGRPPWNGLFSSNAMSAMYHIASSDSTPPLPHSRLSPVAINFLSCCLQRNPNARWSCTQLLLHPFLNPAPSPPPSPLPSPSSSLLSSPSPSPSPSTAMAMDMSMSMSMAMVKTPPSPTSVIDRDWDSAISSVSVPVLNLALRHPGEAMTTEHIGRGGSDASTAVEWITVRSNSGASEPSPLRKAVHLEQGGGEEEGSQYPPAVVLVRKGSEVNLSCLLLMRKRARGGGEERDKPSPGL